MKYFPGGRHFQLRARCEKRAASGEEIAGTKAGFYTRATAYQSKILEKTLGNVI